MDSSAIQQIEDILAKHDFIGIVVSKNPSLDTMAAALSLYLYLKGNNKSVVVASPTEPIVEIASLVGIDKVKTELSGEGGDLSVSFPYKEGEIDKVSYTLENGFLNIIVKAGELGLSFDDKQVKFKRSGGLPTALFIVGTPRISDLGHLFDPQELSQTTVVNIDNKTENQGFGDIVLVSPRYSSVSEQIADLLVLLQVDIDVDIAQNLLSGITSATRNFQDPKTSAIAFEMAGILMRKGAVRETQTFEQVSQARPSVVLQKPQQFFGKRPFPQRQQSQSRQPGFPGQKLYRPSSQAFEEKPLEAVERKEGSFTRGTTTAQQQQVQTGQQSGQPQPRSMGQPRDNKGEDEEAPPDWLAPKVYKGSSLV